MIGQDQCGRIACAMVFADRRVGETHADAAMRAVDIIAQQEREVTVDEVLTWACAERADRLYTNRVRNKRDECFEELLREVGL